MAFDGNVTDSGSENGASRPMSRIRIAAWLAAAVLLLVVFVASQVTENVNWSLGDFVIAGILLFGPLSVYELVVRTESNSLYRIGVGLGLAGAVLLLWVNGAVGITDSGADAMYLGVVAVGVVGSFLARFRARGMAVAMLVTAIAQMSVGVIALITGIVAAHNSAFEVLGISGFFAALFLGSAILFRESERTVSGAE